MTVAEFDPFELIHPWSNEAQEHLSNGIQLLERDERKVIVLALEHLALIHAQAGEHRQARWVRWTASKFSLASDG